MKRITPVRAVIYGLLTVSLPVLCVIFIFGILGFLLGGVDVLTWGLLVGALIAWPVWSFLVPRWRDWVEDSGLKGEDVQRLAVWTLLLWPKGSIFERTEFKRRNGKKGW